MEQKILNKIKKSYEDGLKRKKHYSEILKEVKELEQAENVKRYIELKNRLEQVNYEKIIGETEEQILERAFNSWTYAIQKTNEIYLCMGTFMIDSICDIVHGPSDIRLTRNDPRAEYRIYRNIEDGYPRQIPIRKCEEFEQIHKIIFPKIDYLANKYFYELQREFFSISITEGQEKACSKILSKTK